MSLTPSLHPSIDDVEEEETDERNQIAGERNEI